MKDKNISKKQVRKISKLANLKLSLEEIKDYQSKLEIILEYFKAIKDVEVNSVQETMIASPLHNKFREDVVTKSLTQKEALSNSKKQYQGYFVTKAVFKS